MLKEIDIEIDIEMHIEDRQQETDRQTGVVRKWKRMNRQTIKSGVHSSIKSKFPDFPDFFPTNLPNFS